jgi:MFS transporter, SP family, galactose:H+ symporter
MQVRQQAPSTSWRFVILIMCFAGLGGVLYGYDIGVIAGALTFMQSDIHLTTAQLSLIVAAVLGGGSIATLLSGSLADWWGRKKMILAAALIFSLGIITLISAHSFHMILIGRLIQGIGVGVVIIVVPLYLVEIIPAQFRGRAVSVFQCFLTAGILLASVVDLIFIRSGNWRAMFACALVPSVILFFGTLKLSESPRWLFKKGRAQEARLALALCASEEEVAHEMQEMADVANFNKQHKKINFLQKRYMLPFFIALAIACLNQLTGINSLLQFSTYILKQSGLDSNLFAMLGTVGITLVNFLTTLLAFFLIDKVGRRPLMNFGTAGIVVSLAFCGAINFFMPVGSTQGYLIIFGMLVYILSYAIGPGVIVWLVVSEMLPTVIRGKGMSICLFVNSMISTVLASLFLTISQHIGYAGNFWLCSFFTIFYFILVYKYLPESRGKTLEEIEVEFKDRAESN